MRAWLLIAAGLVACASPPEGHQLRIDLRTDFLPGAEFDAVTVSLGTGDIRESFSHVVDTGRSYITGVALGDVRVDPGPHDAEVTLFRDGDVVIARQVSVVVDAPITIATVVITRDCRGIMCPGEGDSALLESCLGGRCADPRCTIESPEFCPDGTCFGPTDCTLHACADASCVLGACLYEPNDNQCEDAQRCDLERGCVAIGVDAGARDAGPRDAGARDVGGMDAFVMDSGSDAMPDVFDAGPPDVPADVFDAGPPPFDAGPPPGCPAVDGNTVFLYDFDSLRDRAGNHAAMTPNGASRPSGMSPCGGRLLDTGDSALGRFLVPDDATFHLDEGSIDFWVRRPSGEGPRAVGLFSRDATDQALPGHLTLFLTEDRKLVLRGQDSVTSFICSATMPENRWIRVGINFGPGGLELYMDGVRQEEGGTVVLYEDIVSTCGSANGAFSIAGNNNPFVLGVSIHGSDEGADTPIQYPGRDWRFDQFRLSRVRRNYATEL